MRRDAKSVDAMLQLQLQHMERTYTGRACVLLPPPPRVWVRRRRRLPLVVRDTIATAARAGRRRRPLS